MTFFKLALCALTLSFASSLSKAQSGQGDNIYDDTYLHTIEINFYETNYWDSLEYYYDELYDANGDLIIGADKTYMRAAITIDGNVLDTVGVRLKGYFSNWGSQGQKKPFKVDINEFVAGQKYDGIKKFNLGNAFQDPTFLRDKLSLDMMRDAGVITARCSFAKLYLNGEYWGLYTVIEQIDKDFLELNFGDSVGYLYKNMDNSNLEWEGSNPVSYQDQFELKTNEDNPDWDGFVHWVNVLNNTPDAAYKDSMDANMDMHTFYTALAVDRFLDNWDSYMDHGRNFYVYQNPYTNKFVWIPWDYNLSFSDRDFEVMPSSGGWWNDPKPLIDNSLDNTDFKNQYLSIACNLVHNVVDLNAFNQRVDELADMIRQAVYDDTKKETSNADFDQNLSQGIVDGWSILPGLKPLVNSKKSSFIQDIAGENFPCNVSISESELLDITVDLFPNPAQGQVMLNIADIPYDLTVRLMGLNGQVMKEVLISDQNSTIDITGMAGGVYLMEITGERVREVQKLVIY